MKHRIDLTKPVSFRVPLDYREKFSSDAVRLNMTATELAQKLVIRGLMEDESEIIKRDFVLKNTAFMTQLVSEILDLLSPEEAENIRIKSQNRTQKIIDAISGGYNG